MYYANASLHSLPNFIKKLHPVVTKCWTTTGSICCKFHKLPDESYEVMYFPAIVEFMGGPYDGAKDFAGFHFNVCKFSKVFDKPGVKIALNCADKNITEHLICYGNVDGVKVKLAILIAPPEGSLPTGKVYFSKVEER